jgi:hypothetical protein
LGLVALVYEHKKNPQTLWWKKALKSTLLLLEVLWLQNYQLYYIVNIRDLSDIMRGIVYDGASALYMTF